MVLCAEVSFGAIFPVILLFLSAVLIFYGLFWLDVSFGMMRFVVFGRFLRVGAFDWLRKENAYQLIHTNYSKTNIVIFKKRARIVA